MLLITKDGLEWRASSKFVRASPVLNRQQLNPNAKVEVPFNLAVVALVDGNKPSGVQSLQTLAEVVMACNWFCMPETWCGCHKFHMDLAILETIRQSSLANMVYGDERVTLWLSEGLHALFPTVFPKIVSESSIRMWSAGFAHLLVLQHSPEMCKTNPVYQNDPLQLAFYYGGDAVTGYALRLWERFRQDVVVA